MSVTYTIHITNNFSIAQEYLLFISPPAPTTGDTVQVFSNIFQKTPKIQPITGAGSFTIRKGYYAICGTSQVSLASGVSVESSDSISVSLGSSVNPTSLGSTLSMTVDSSDPSNPAPSIALDPTPESDVGSYQIVTGGDFTYPNESKLPTSLPHPQISYSC